MKKNVFTDKYYTHLDVKKKHTDYEQRVKNENWVKKHGFYPFIHFQIKFNKYVVGEAGKKEKKNKIRDIYYSAHIDRFIYQYYGNKLNDRYNEYTKKTGINKVSTAYRNSNIGKCNIDFAKEVLEFIVEAKEAYVFIGDFSKFFDKLDHIYLKEQLCKVQCVGKLNEADYAIYKNITRFAYVEADDIEDFKGKKRKDMREMDKFFSTEEFQRFKKQYLYKHCETYGIPQGSSISSVYANVYMIDFDKSLNDYATSRGGIYRRYCDDIILIIPMNKNQVISNEHLAHINYVERTRDEIKNLTLNMDKTEQFFYSNGTIEKLSGDSSRINYLGFSFDGKTVRIREKSIFKYYCRAYKKVKSVQVQPTDRARIAAKKALFKSYTHLGNSRYQKGNGNFLTYAYKAQAIFDESNLLENSIRSQVKRHWKKINDKLNKQL